MEITRENIRRLRGDINTALKELCELYDMKIELEESSRYTSTEVRFRLTAENIDDNGAPASVQENKRQLLDWGRMDGIPVEYLIGHKSFYIQNQSFTITGFKPRARKNNYVLTNRRGKEYVGCARLIKRSIGVQ